MTLEQHHPWCRRAVVLYEHELLGEGIADQLRRGGVQVVVVRTSDDDAVAAALASRPCLVVAERATRGHRDRIRSLSPGARFVDVSRVVGRGVPDEHHARVDLATILSALDEARGDA